MPSTPHPFLSWLLALVASAFLGSCGSGAGEHQDPTSTLQPPNVVVILLDTLRADVLSFYGAEDERAPYLAKLATEGTVFEKAFSTSTWTAPATASMLTGVYPDRHGVTRGFLAQFREGEAVDEDVLEQMELLAISTDVPTMAEYFKQAGYNTFALASNVNIGPEMAFDRGFDEFERHDMEPAKFLRDRLLAMRSRIKAGDAPSFLYLHFNDVHKPYEARPRFYRPDEKRDETAEHLERYRSELGYLDSFLARIHQAMAFDDDTLIVVVADHGEEFREHGQLYHEFTLHVELNRIPFLIRAPGLRVKPGRVRENVSLIDVVPTIFDLIGLDVPADLDGRSLAAFCRSDDKRQGLRAESEALIQRPLILHRFEDGEHLWGVILENWKLIQSHMGVLLYDLNKDPEEQNNLAQGHELLVQQLVAILDEHRGRGSNPQSIRTQVEIDQDLLDRLKAIGYVK
jgi:arylsulfatase A-like enzyme